MRTSLNAVDRNTEAFAGMHTQAGLPMLGAVTGPQVLAPEVVQRATFNGLLSEAARHSGKDDQMLADEINVSQGYMSRCMRGMFEAWAKRFIAFMRSTNSVAPLQFICEHMGGDFVLRSRHEAERAALLARLRQLENGRDVR